MTTIQSNIGWSLLENSPLENLENSLTLATEQKLCLTSTDKFQFKTWIRDDNNEEHKKSFILTIKFNNLSKIKTLSILTNAKFIELYPLKSENLKDKKYLNTCKSQSVSQNRFGFLLHEELDSTQSYAELDLHFLSLKENPNLVHILQLDLETEFVSELPEEKEFIQPSASMTDGLNSAMMMGMMGMFKTPSLSTPSTITPHFPPTFPSAQLSNLQNYMPPNQFPSTSQLRPTLSNPSSIKEPLTFTSTIQLPVTLSPNDMITLFDHPQVKQLLNNKVEEIVQIKMKILEENLYTKLSGMLIDLNANLIINKDIKTIQPKNEKHFEPNDVIQTSKVPEVMEINQEIKSNEEVQEIINDEIN